MKYVNFGLLALSFLLMSGSIKTDKTSTGYYPGNQIPNIVLTGLEGQNIDINDYKGKKVVLNFWAAYDAHSRANNVRLSNFLKENNSNVEFVSVSLDENTSVSNRTALLDKIDGKSHFSEVNGTNSEIYKEFNLEKGFRSYLIDEQGVIQAINPTNEILKVLI